MRFPSNAWVLASTPVGATDKNGDILFKESTESNNLVYGKNRAKLAWYVLESSVVEPNSGIPGFVKKDPMQHYIRLVRQQQVFTQKT